MEFGVGLGSKLELSTQSISEVNEHTVLTPPPPVVLQYSIAKDRLRREIRPPRNMENLTWWNVLKILIPVKKMLYT